MKILQIVRDKTRVDDRLKGQDKRMKVLNVKIEITNYAIGITNKKLMNKMFKLYVK